MSTYFYNKNVPIITMQSPYFYNGLSRSVPIFINSRKKYESQAGIYKNRYTSGQSVIKIGALVKTTRYAGYRAHSTAQVLG